MLCQVLSCNKIRKMLELRVGKGIWGISTILERLLVDVPYNQIDESIGFKNENGPL